MTSSKPSPPRRRRTIRSSRRAQLLAAFDRSGLSSAAFARQHGIRYSTFCGWRRRRASVTPASGFVEVEVTPSSAPVELVIELGVQGRMRLTSASQIDLAARLLHRLNAPKAC